MSAGRLCSRSVDLAEPGESALVAAQRMHARNVGTLVVLDAKRTPIGMLTDRDLTLRVLAQGLDPVATTVRQVMSPDPETVSETTPIEDALRVMRRGPCRRVPVVDKQGQLVGLLSLDDILALLTEEFRSIGSLLKQETPGRLAEIE